MAIKREGAFQRELGGSGFENVKGFELQCIHQPPANRRIVFDDQDSLGAGHNFSKDTIARQENPWPLATVSYCLARQQPSLIKPL